MKREDFIKEQVQQLRNDVSEYDVIYNVKRFAKTQTAQFQKSGGAMNFCMQLYAEIYLETYRE